MRSIEEEMKIAKQSHFIKTNYLKSYTKALTSSRDKKLKTLP